MNRFSATVHSKKRAGPAIHPCSWILASLWLSCPYSGTAQAQEPPAASAPAAAVTPDPAGLFRMDLDEQPTYIKSDTLTLRTEEHLFLYSGNVEVTHGEMIMTCDRLEGYYDQDNQIQRLIALQSVVITKGEGVRATCERATYEKQSETLTLTDNPELQQGASVLTADAITVFLKEDRSTASGAVRVKVVQPEQGKEDSDSASGSVKEKKKNKNKQSKMDKLRGGPK